VTARRNGRGCYALLCFAQSEHGELAHIHIHCKTITACLGRSLRVAPRPVAYDWRSVHLLPNEPRQAAMPTGRPLLHGDVKSQYLPVLSDDVHRTPRWVSRSVSPRWKRAAELLLQQRRNREPMLPLRGQPSQSWLLRHFGITKRSWFGSLHCRLAAKLLKAQC